MTTSKLKKGGIHQAIDQLKNAGWRPSNNASIKELWINDKLGACIDQGIVGHKWLLFNNGDHEWSLLDYNTDIRYPVRTISGLNNIIRTKSIKI